MAGLNPYKGKDVLVGSHSTLWWNSEEVFEVESFEAKIKIEREGVTFAGSLDEDSVIKGLKGEGKFKIKHIYNRGLKAMLLAIKEGKDPRAELLEKIKNPENNKTERIAINNVWFSEFTLAEFELGKKLEREFSFGFTVRSVEILDEIV